MKTLSDMVASLLPNFAMVFAAVIFFGALLIGVQFIAKKSRPSRGRPKRNRPKQTRNYQQSSANFAADQLKIVSTAAFTARALLNRSEANVFAALDQAVIARNPGWQVMAQVSLGEFLASPDKDAFLAINSKRVDFALMDEQCCVRHALEYQGNGHHLGTSAAARDAVKKEALRKAGIGYHEVVAGHTTPGELRALVEKLVPGV
jgi:Protein of unknown function (DUF2726)